MSRSNPVDSVASPVTKWFEWDSKGAVAYYDKSLKAKVSVGLGFTFLLLDQLSRVGGFHEPSNGGIYSNEVRNIGGDVLTVRTKAGVLAQGKYGEIKEAIKAAGGKFVQQCYIAYRLDAGAPLSLGSLQLKGAALSAFLEFAKEHRAALYGGAISIVDAKAGKKGSVKYTSPVFDAVEASPEDSAQALVLDRELQAFLAVSLKRKPQADADDDVPAHTDADAPGDSNEAGW